ncbi:MAG: nucleotidyltransferase domain-containing protein, partial [Candidatus Caldarchaeum sp.]|nr:nucleotidyltransferase domain-containing protein [Candidatus Caldarchaeum sp.]
MWLPRWLGEAYAKLYFHFGNDVFGFNDARAVLELRDENLRVALSRLHAVRAVHVFQPTKPRKYRLADPSGFTLLSSGEIFNVEKIRQERYLNLILLTAKHIIRGLKDVSMAIFGSVARGTAEPQSDVDILVVSDDFAGSLGQRVDKLFDHVLGQDVRAEVRWLFDNKVYANLSFLPLTRREVGKRPTVLLDLTDDAVIIYDDDEFLQKALVEMKA